MKGCEDVGPWAGRPRAQMMKSDEVEAMLHLHALGSGLRRIAKEFGCSKNTVRRHVGRDHDEAVLVHAHPATPAAVGGAEESYDRPRAPDRRGGVPARFPVRLVNRRPLDRIRVLV